MGVVAISEEVLDPERPPRNRHGVERLTQCLSVLDRLWVHIEIAGGWSPHTNLRIDLLDRQRRDFVQLKILCLRTTAKERLIEIRLVPHLEVPSSHLVDSVTRNPLLYQCLHQIPPLVGVGRRAPVRMPPKRRVLDRCDLARRKPKLDKRPYSPLQHPVVKVVDILEVVDRLPRIILAIYPHVVMEDTVKSDVLKAIVLSRLRQFLLPRRPQSFVRASCTDNLAPEVHEWDTRPLRIRLQVDPGSPLTRGACPLAETTTA